MLGSGTSSVFHVIYYVIAREAASSSLPYKLVLGFHIPSV